MNCKKFEMKCRDYVQGNILGHLSKYGWFAGRDLNPGPLECEAGMLIT
jgi:hypothetical protein